MEKWLEDLIEEIRKNSEKSLLETMKDKPLEFSMKLEAGQDIANFKFDLRGLVDKVAVPAQLFKMGFDGIENTLKSLEIPLQKDRRIKGYSESEYRIPFYLEDEKRLILFEPMFVSGFMEALGLGDFAYTIFSPFLALEFFKYIDIMNSQTKPTLMAFIGITNFKEVTNVNFMDFIKSSVSQIQPKTENKSTDKKTPQQNIFEFLPRNTFKIYGIPEFKVPLVDGLRLSRYDPQKNTESRKIKAYANSIGIAGFLNPSVVDYALFTTNMVGKTSPKTVGDILQGGDALGHSPSKSQLIPDAKPTEVINDPLILLNALKRQDLLTEMTGKYKLTSNGLRMVEAEVVGKPKETSLSKVWNVIKKAKEILPFLKFL